MLEFIKQHMDRKGWFRGLGLHHGLLAVPFTYIFGAEAVLLGFILKEDAETKHRLSSEKLYTGYQRPKDVEWLDIITPTIVAYGMKLWL